MNNLVQLAYAHLETLLLVVAVLQALLAILNLFIARILKWGPEIARMSPLLKDVFHIHSWYISLTLLIWAVLTGRFAEEMANYPSDLTRWLCGAIAIFWGLRCVLQWLHYSPAHWKGQTGRTIIHWTLFVGYALWTAIYLLGAWR